MRTAETRSDGDGVQARQMALPVDLERRLRAFRGLVWRIKLFEAIAAALCGVLSAYLVLFCVDRLLDTPPVVRGLISAAAAVACAAVPYACHRWIWNHRGLDQVARLIARRFPSLGDQLLGAGGVLLGRVGERRERFELRVDLTEPTVDVVDEHGQSSRGSRRNRSRCPAMTSR